ncbi:hypothetical protein SADUNF_Sadunf09G0064200 [Salix dunnii]|uniref:Uncharacterized protein n=1 Tax=Salix dunnii TaxID=1413687 RepID=A0A835MT78_9ROSI|nr:hypothetical protein SADUNF_Sadunf09G0064200 [Salix dunnii]
MNDPKYGYPYPPQGSYMILSLFKASNDHLILVSRNSNDVGAYQGPPPVMAPPQYYAPPPPPQRQVGFLEGWYAFYFFLHFLQLYVAAACWMSVAVTLQLYLSPNDACDYSRSLWL